MWGYYGSYTQPSPLVLLKKRASSCLLLGLSKKNKTSKQSSLENSLFFFFVYWLYSVSTVDLSGWTRTGSASGAGDWLLSEGGDFIFISSQPLLMGGPRQQKSWRDRSSEFQKWCRHLQHWNAACFRCLPRCFKALCSELLRLPQTWQRRRALRPEVLGGCLTARWTSRAPGRA